MHESTPRRFGQLRNQAAGLLALIAWTVMPVTTVLAQPQTQAEVYMYIDTDGDGVLEETLLDATTPALSGKTPVLFVHGHDLENPADQAFNFRRNWQQPGNGLTSFKAALDHANNDWLDIEPYFIRLVTQDRSIVDDAREIEWAVEHILKRHDSSHVPYSSTPTNTLKLSIIAYSKGTISTRCYLNSLHAPAGEPGPCHFGAPRGDFNPVSEFIAIAPPNHGLAANLAALALASGSHVLNSLAVKQLNNGYKHDCSQFFTQRAQSENFIQMLNGHAITDTKPPAGAPSGWLPGNHDQEAPGSRPKGSASGTGTLYVSLYADSTSSSGALVARDLVGGHFPSDDCQGRLLAKNLATDAENLEVSAIPGQNRIDVHANAVHTPEVVCLALYTVSRHDLPGNPGTLACTKDGQIPLIPKSLPWWWPLIAAIVFVLIVVIGLRVMRRHG